MAQSKSTEYYEPVNNFFVITVNESEKLKTDVNYANFKNCNDKKENFFNSPQLTYKQLSNHKHITIA